MASMSLLGDTTESSKLSVKFDKTPCWKEAVRIIQANVTELNKLSQSVREDSKNLVNGNILSVERRLAQVRQLCAHRQPRLKTCFLKVEEKVIKAQMVLIQTAKTSAKGTVRQLHDKELLRPDELTTLEQKVIEVDASFAKDVESLGYSDTTSFLESASGLLGIASAVGGTGMLLHVSLTSTSLGALLAGTGTTAGLSTGACMGLATGGVFFVVAAAGGLGYLLTKLARQEGDEASKEICSAMCEALDGIKEAHSAAADHNRKLDAIRVKLGELEVMAKD